MSAHRGRNGRSTEEVLGAASRDRILVVLPYGMSFREVVLNDSLWSHLRERYTIDVLTPLLIPPDQREAIGVRTVFRPADRTFAERAVFAVSTRLQSLRYYMSYADFYLEQNLGGLFNSIYVTFFKPQNLHRRILLLGGVSGYRPGHWISAALNRVLPLRSLYRRVFRSRYRFVLVTHPAELECVLTALEANSRGIPVICYTMGLDNVVTNGPLLFHPAMLWVWGPVQESEFQRFYASRDEALAQTWLRPVGCLGYDRLLSSEDPAALDRYGLADHRYLLFPATLESLFPGQVELCSLILRILRDLDPGLKICVRARPGHDIDQWERFAAAHRKDVVLQVPCGSSFDKSFSDIRFDARRDAHEVAEYASLIRGSRGLIIPDFSTTQVNAMALGTPSVVVQFSPASEEVARIRRRSFREWCTLYPFDRCNVAFDERELREGLRGLVASPSALRESISEVVDLFAANRGRAGQAAVRALEEFLPAWPGGRPARIMSTRA